MTFPSALRFPFPTAMKNHNLLRLLRVVAAACFLVLSAGAAMAQEIVVEDLPGATNVLDNTTIVNLGSVEVGSPPSGTIDKTFRIRNTGAANLTLTGTPRVVVGGADPSQFSITPSQPSTPIAPATFSDFTVRFAPTSRGIKTATLSIANNDGDENPFEIKLTATATAPEIKVDQGANADVTSTNFGTLDLGANPNDTSTRNFTITNNGDANLTLSLSGLTGTDFSVTTAPTSPVTPGGTASFTVTFDPSSGGTKTATLHIGNNDPDGSENPYDIAFTGVALAPEIVVEQGGSGISDNGSYNFGSAVGGSDILRTFTIKNIGDSNLSGLIVTVDGTNSAEFKVPTTPNGTIPGPNGTTNFTVEFSPAGTGTRMATLHIANNDLDESPFDIMLMGDGVAPPAGSDTFGYRYTTTPQNAIKLSPTESGVNNATDLIGDDTAQAISLGFTFFFYDKPYTTCTASTNGLITFEQPITIQGARSYSPVAFPNTGLPNNCIAPFWTDLVLGTNSKILYTTRGTAPNRVFIIDYQNMEQYNNAASGSSAEKVSFQLLLYEGSNIIEVQLKEKSGFDDGKAVAIGIENSLGTVGINYPGRLFPTAFKFTRPVFYTIESKYLPPGSPPPVALDNCTTTDGSTAVTCLSTAGLAAGMSVSGTNIAPGTTIVAVSGSGFTLSLPATGNGVALSLSASYAVDVGTRAPSVLNPRIGTGKSDYGTVQRFEAPEFIYLNKDFEELAEVGDLNAPDTAKAWYRLVNDGYALDGQVVQGTQLFFTTTLDHDVTVVWRWKLEFAVIIDSATGQGGFGNPVPVVGRAWRPLGDQFTAAIDSTIEAPGAGLRFRTVGYTFYDKNGALVSPGILFPTDAATRRATVPMSVTQPLRLMWNFVGQVRYRFDAATAANAGTSFDGQAFLRVYQADRVTPDTSFGPGGVVYGSGVNKDVWIDSGLASSSSPGRKVEVGAFYRSTDGFLTLSSFGAPPAGDLTGVSLVTSLNDDTSVVDQQGQPRVSRIFTVRNVTAPTEIHWVYQTTTFRAVVALGERLDAVNPNDQLTPGLPGLAVLKTSDTGPGNTITTKVFPPTGSLMNGDALRWDVLGKGLFPVRPGIYEVAWPDANDAATNYRVEVTTGYPGDLVTRASASEDSSGARILEGAVALTNCATTDASAAATCSSTSGLSTGMLIRGPNIATGSTIASITNGTQFVLSLPATASGAGLALTAWKNYLNTVALPDIDPKLGFPAQTERAHYHHLFDPAASRQAPTKLDLSALDEWKFQDITFADTSVGAMVNKSTPGIPFTAVGAGRSVLLYSYRPNPDEIADGTLTQENLAVRVVRSSPVNVIPRTDAKLVLGQRGLQLGGGAATAGGAFGIVGSGGSVNPGNQFVIDFWLNAKGVLSPSAITLTNCTIAGANVTCASTAGLSAGMNVTGANIPSGTKISSVTNATTFVLTAAATNGTGLSLTASYSAATLTNCVTTNGSITLTCASTADVVAGMSLSGPNIAPGTKIAGKTNATTLTLSAPATGDGAGQTLNAANKPVTILSSGTGGLKVTLDATASTVTATYRGIAVTHALSKAGASWRHYVVHVFDQEVFGTAVTVVDFYLDGSRKEQALPTAFLQGSADSTVAPALGPSSFRFGVDADPMNGLQLDQFRLFTFSDFPTDDKGYLTPGEIRQLKSQRDMTVSPTTVASISTSTTFLLSKPATATGTGLTLSAGSLVLSNCATVNGSTTVTCASTTGLSVGAVVTGPNIVAGTQLRNYLPKLWFSFEAAPGAGSFANLGSATVGVGPVTSVSPYTGTWAYVDVQEVATRIDCTLDNAGFGGSGFIRNEISNYNAVLYQRTAEVGAWGPIFPVNDNQLFTDPAKKLEVVYYENPYLIDRVPHPNVAWPYVVTEYKDVGFPAVGPHKDKAIYIASRIGTEGVDKNGRPQAVFDLARYSGLTDLQPAGEIALAGYNPNEEHALTAPSGRAALKVKNLGEDPRQQSAAGRLRPAERHQQSSRPIPPIPGCSCR